MRKDINGNDLHPDDVNSVVRSNMMNNKFYRGYCGEAWNKNCSMPRTKWIPELSQFQCPDCGWVSQYPADFITRYKTVHNIK